MIIIGTNWRPLPSMKPLFCERFGSTNSHHQAFPMENLENRDLIRLMRQLKSLRFLHQPKYLNSVLEIAEQVIKTK